jgi:hypothetical protein
MGKGFRARKGVEKIGGEAEDEGVKCGHKAETLFILFGDLPSNSPSNLHTENVILFAGDVAVAAAAAATATAAAAALWADVCSW